MANYKLRGTTITSIQTLTSTNLVIAAGVITVTLAKHSTSNEASAGTDDIDTINVPAGSFLFYMKANSSSEDPTYKDGSGNIIMAGDFTFTSASDSLLFGTQADTNTVKELSRSDNA